MTHGDSVIHSDGVELAAHASCLGNFHCHQLAHILEVNMPWHELGEGVGNGNDRLVEILILEASGAPQRAGTGHIATLGGGV